MTENIKLKTERLILRRWKPSDHEPFHRMNSDSAVMEHFPKHLSREESDGMMERMNSHIEQHGFGFWAVETKVGGEFIGFTGLLRPSFETHFTPCVEVGWRLAKKFWGKGFASEAARASLAFGFYQAGLEEIVSFTVPANLRSIAVMERLGMKRNPAEDFGHPKVPEGHKLRMHVLYRLKREEFGGEKAKTGW